MRERRWKDRKDPSGLTHRLNISLNNKFVTRRHRRLAIRLQTACLIEKVLHVASFDFEFETTGLLDNKALSNHKQFRF